MLLNRNEQKENSGENYSMQITLRELVSNWKRSCVIPIIWLQVIYDVLLEIQKAKSCVCVCMILKLNFGK